jgi:hypothetical protein
VLVNTGCEFVTKNLDDLVEDAGRDGDILLDPGDMFDNWDLDRRDVVVTEMTFLSFSTG